MRGAKVDFVGVRGPAQTVKHGPEDPLEQRYRVLGRRIRKAAASRPAAQSEASYAYLLMRSFDSESPIVRKAFLRSAPVVVSKKKSSWLAQACITSSALCVLFWKSTV